MILKRHDEGGKAGTGYMRAGTYTGTECSPGTTGGGQVVDQALVQAAHEMVPLLAAGAEETERLGYLADRSTAALRAAGFLTLFAPRAFGGPEANLATAVAVFAQLGRGCGSSSWVATLLSGGAYIAAHLGDEANQEVWREDPHAAVCGGFGSAGAKARRVSGGLLVSGSWQPLSGIRQASWAIVGVPVPDEHGVVIDAGLVLFPVSAGRIERSWYVAGMQGSGSDSLVVDEVFVPQHRVLSFSRLVAGGYTQGREPGSIYTVGMLPFVTATMTAPLLGMAEAALDYTTDRLARGKAIGTTIYTDAALSPSVRFKVADAALRIDTARLHSARAVSDVENAAAAGTPLDETGRARVRMDAAMAVRSAVEAVRFLLDAGGSSSFALERPIQRVWRDMEVASRHQILGYDLAREIFARSVLGVGDPVTSMF
jgi:3-hydroxy-9,10-secoandrosta-1,3,5(10)-triene-9,17-dione monooxygenase